MKSMIWILFCLMALPLQAQFHPDLLRHSEWQVSSVTLRQQAGHLLEKLQLSAKGKSPAPSPSEWADFENQLLIQDLMLQGLQETVDLSATQFRIQSERENLDFLRQMTLEAMTEANKQQADTLAYQERLALITAKPVTMTSPAIPLWGLAAPVVSAQKATLNGAPPALSPRAKATPLADKIPNAQRMTVPELLQWMANHVAYTPYYGGYRSPEGVLRDGAANDLDGARFFATLLRQLEVPVRYRHGRVQVERKRILQLLKVADAGAASNVLTAAEIPFEAIIEDGEVTSFEIERVWLEVYLPISSYRGVRTGTGDHAWIGIDPMFYNLQTPTLNDPFLNTTFDSTALLNRYESASTRDALFWLENELGNLLDEPLITLRQGFANPAPVPDLLPLALPYEVVGQAETYDTLPDHLFHQIHVSVRDRTTLVLGEAQAALSDFYQQPLVWDAIPASEADAELIDTLGGRFEVPAHLLEVKPTFGVGDQPWLLLERAIPMGEWLELEITITTPAGTQTVSRNRLRAGGYSMVTLQGDGHPLRPFELPAMPAELDPFGDALLAVLLGYMMDTQNQEQRLAHALRVWPVTPAPHLAWAHITYTEITQDGEVSQLDFDSVRLDAEIRATRSVAASADHAQARTRDLIQLIGLLAAQNESLALERLHQDLKAVSVPDLFRAARQSGIEPVTTNAFEQLDNLAFGLPEAVLERYQTYLDRGYDLRFLSDGFTPVDQTYYAARIRESSSGRTAWLLDTADAGSILQPTPEQREQILDGARYPDLTRIIDAEEIHWIVPIDQRFLFTTADEPNWEFSYQVLNSNGRPVSGAKIGLLGRNEYPVWRSGAYAERHWSTDKQGFVDFNIPSAQSVSYSPFVSSGNTCSLNLECYDELAGLFSFMPIANNKVTSQLHHHVLMQPGDLKSVKLVFKEWEGETRWLSDHQRPAGFANEFRVLALDEHNNCISNQDVILESGTSLDSYCTSVKSTLMEYLALFQYEESFEQTGYFFDPNGAEARSGTLLGVRTSFNGDSIYYFTSKLYDHSYGCGQDKTLGTDSVAAYSALDSTIRDTIDLDSVWYADTDLYWHGTIRPSIGSNSLCNYPSSTCSPSVHTIDPEDTRKGLFHEDYSFCETGFGSSGMALLNPNQSGNSPQLISVGGVDELCVDFQMGRERRNGLDFEGWPQIFYNVDNHDQLYIPAHFTETKLVRFHMSESEVDTSNCVLAIPCDMSRVHPDWSTVVVIRNGLGAQQDSFGLQDLNNNFFIPVDNLAPRIQRGHIRINNYLIGGAGTQDNEDVRTSGSTGWKPFVYGLYQVHFGNLNVAPLVLDKQSNRLINDGGVILAPNILPNLPGGRPFASERVWMFRIMARPKNATTPLPEGQYIAITQSTGIGRPYAKINPGFVLDPDMDYFLEFAFDVISSVDSGSPRVSEEGDIKFFPLRVVKDPSLLVTDFEDHVLFLDSELPATTSGKRSAEDCFRPPSGPYFGFPVLPQKVFHFLGQDYRTVRLEAFLDNPNRGGQRVYVSEDIDVTYDPNVVAPSFDMASPEPPIVSPVPLDQLNGLYWRMVGTNNGIETEGEPTFLRHLFLIGGAGVVDSGDVVRTRYVPEYVFEFDEDPSGQTDNSCLFIEREVGFSLNKDARVTFILDGQTLVDDLDLTAGDYAYPVEMGFLGRKDWVLEATFSTQGGGATGGPKQVTLTREGFVETRRRINNKLNIGSTSVKGVNLVSGSLTLSHTDFALGGVGQGLQFTRTYNNSQGENYSPMGYGWTHNYQSRLVVSGCNDLTIVGGDGSGMVFRQEPGSDELTPLMPGVHGTLSENELGGFTYRTKSGTHWIYGPPISPQDVGLSHPRYYSQNLLAVVDPFNNTTTFEYNSQTGYLETVRTSDGRGLKLSYLDQGGRILLEQIETQGMTPSITVEYRYDAWGRLLSAERGDKLETYGYPDACDGLIARNNVIAYSNGNGQTTTYTYQTEDPDNEFAVDVITAITEPEGRTYQFSYSDGGDVRTATVSDGLATTEYTFDLRGRPTEISGPLGSKTMVWADDDVLLESEVNEAGQEISYSYDDNGNMTERSVNGATESWKFDQKWNKPLEYTDRLGNKTTWLLDASTGFVMSMTDAAGGETRYDKTVEGLVKEITDPNGDKTSIGYDAHGYPVSTQLPDESSITRRFDGRGRLLAEARPGGETTFSYNDLDHLVEQVTQLEGGPARVVSYDDLQPLGQPASKSDGMIQVSYAYDGLNRVISETVDPGQNQPAVSRSFSYDVHDNVTSEVIDGGSAQRRFVNRYDGAGRLLSQEMNGQAHRLISYRSGTKLVTQETDWRGATTRLSYDGLLYLSSRTLPTGHIEQFTHDANGNRVSYTDGDGRATSYIYDELNRQVSMTNPVGHQISMDYDGVGNLLRQVNSTTGAGFAREYDGRGRVTREAVFRDGGNQVTTISYGNGGLTVERTPPEDATITERYNLLGELVSREQNGITTGYTYDANGGIAEVRHPLGYRTTYQRDGFGRPVSVELPEGYSESWAYDGFGNVVAHTDRRGVTVTSTYDDYNRPLTRAYASGFGNANEAWSYQQSSGQINETYTDLRGHTITRVLDPLDRVLSVADPLRGASTSTYSATHRTGSVDFNGNAYTYRHDGLNRLVSRTGPGGEISTAFNDGSNQVATTDRRGVVTVVQYDQVGNLLSRTVGGTRVEQHTYDGQNRALSSVDGAGIATTRSFDDLGRLLTETTGPEVTTYSDYDDLGRPATIDDGRSQTRLTYDFYGRVLSRTNGEGQTTTMTYDAVGNVLTRTAPGPTGDATWTYGYNLLNQITRVVDPLSLETSLEWSNSYQTLALTDAEGETSTWQYDAAGRLTSMQRPGLGSIGYAYDGNDNQIEIAFAASQATLTYDHNNLVLNESWNSEGQMAGVEISRTRDAEGNLTSVTQTSRSVSFTREIEYDALSRPVGIEDSDGLAINLGYYGNGTRSYLELPSGLRMDYGYDTANRLVSVDVTGQGTTAYSYLANGLVAGIDYANGMAASFDYDLAGRPVLADYLRAGGERTSFTAGYFDDGSREWLREDRGALGVWETQYTYDAASRLVEFTRITPDFERTTTYDLDDVGNRRNETENGDDYNRTRTYQLGAGHRVTGFDERIVTAGVVTSKSATYTYDGNGNRVQKVTRDDGVVTSHVMGWDARNRMVSLEENGTPKLTMHYDDLDRRVLKIGDTRGDIRYVWNELAVLEEYEHLAGPQGVLASYSYGLERLSMQRVGGEVYTYSYDMNGSAADLVANNGSLVQAQTYTPFGTMEKIVETGFGGFNRLGFSGHEWDPESELTYAKARYYDQDLGTFTSQDPVLGDFGTPPSLHRYMYAFHNPTRFYDPTGLASEDQYEENSEEKTSNFLQSWGRRLAELASNIMRDVDVLDTDNTTYQKFKWGAGLIGRAIGEVTRDTGDTIDLGLDLTGGALYDYFEMDQLATPNSIFEAAKHDSDLLSRDINGELDAYQADAEGYVQNKLKGLAARGIKFSADLINEDRDAVNRAATTGFKFAAAGLIDRVASAPRVASRFGSRMKGPAKADTKVGSKETVGTRSLNLAKEPTPDIQVVERAMARDIEPTLMLEYRRTEPPPLYDLEVVDAPVSSVNGNDIGKYSVGPYNSLKGKVPGLDAHHVGQKAIMKRLIPGYDASTAPSILVPKVGHTIRGPRGIVSRSTKGLENPRQVLARDIFELRRVYQDIPNKALQELIEMNKQMYQNDFKKE